MPAPTATHRCPWWLAFLLTSPVRRLFDNPSVILSGLVQPGQVVLELGPGNGYFSVPIASALGQSGRLIAVDVQPQMLKFLARRLERKGLARCLVCRRSQQVERELGDLAGQVDLVVAINVIHELPKPRETIGALAETLRENGRLLLVEPRGHVSPTLFETELTWARDAGLRPVPQVTPSRSRRLHALLHKPAST